MQMIKLLVRRQFFTPVFVWRLSFQLAGFFLTFILFRQLHDFLYRIYQSATKAMRWFWIFYIAHSLVVHRRHPHGSV